MMYAARTCTALIFLLLLPGCGFHPLYGTTSENSGVSQALADVSVAEADTRLGQIIRNDLISKMRPPGVVGQDKYYLVVTPQSKATDIIETKQPDATRQSLSVSVTFDLKEDGKVIYSGKSFAQVSYDQVSTADPAGGLMIRDPLANYQAKISATERAAHELSADIHTRLAAYFSSH